MSVDVEGLDLQVLRYNDWKVYRPKVIIAEVETIELESCLQDEVVLFLKNKGYKLIGKPGKSVVFFGCLISPNIHGDIARLTCSAYLPIFAPASKTYPMSSLLSRELRNLDSPLTVSDS